MSYGLNWSTFNPYPVIKWHVFHVVIFLKKYQTEIMNLVFLLVVFPRNLVLFFLIHNCEKRHPWMEVEYTKLLTGRTACSKQPSGEDSLEKWHHFATYIVFFHVLCRINCATSFVTHFILIKCILPNIIIATVSL